MAKKVLVVDDRKINSERNPFFIGTGWNGSNLCV